jgi:hypothetical protein
LFDSIIYTREKEEEGGNERWTEITERYTKKRQNE